MNLRDKDYLSIVEALHPTYGSPEQRLKWLRSSAGIVDQEDGSRFELVTIRNYRDILAHQRKVDIPTNNVYAKTAIRYHIDQGYRVYRFWFCWVKDEIADDRGIWLYLDKVAELKNVSPKTVTEYCSMGNLTCKFLRGSTQYPKRKYVKDDLKLAYWLNVPVDERVLNNKLLIIEKLLYNFENNKVLFLELEQIERNSDLILRGTYSRTQPHQFFKRALGKVPRTSHTWQDAINNRKSKESGT